MTVRNCGYEIGETRIQNWNIIPTPIGFELALPVRTEIKNYISEEHYAEFVNAYVYCSKEQNKKARLGIGAFERPIYVRHSKSDSASLLLRITHSELGKLDDWRQNSDLTIELHASAVGFDGFQWSGADLHAQIYIARSSWIDCLTRLGFFRTVYSELPVSEPYGDPTLSTPITKLENAQRNIAAGEYNAAIRDCRVVLEVCGTVVFGQKKWADQAFKPFQDQNLRKEMSVDDRERAIFAACRHYTHAFAHEEDEDIAPDASYEEAKMLVTLAATAVYRARTKLK